MQSPDDVEAPRYQIDLRGLEPYACMGSKERATIQGLINPV